jgi:hypothetical protein
VRAAHISVILLLRSWRLRQPFAASASVLGLAQFFYKRNCIKLQRILLKHYIYVLIRLCYICCIALQQREMPRF